MTRSDIYEEFTSLTGDESMEIVKLESVYRTLSDILDMDDDEMAEKCDNIDVANALIRHYRRVLRSMMEFTSISSIVYEKLDAAREYFMGQCVKEADRLYNEYLKANDYE